ncbi:MAG: aminoacyl-histidine dipeptidase [Fusobacteriaceae bacterium]|nr:aminoacyl-histidine dipeptidase [Fusobacteriaceae bacterium]
MKVLENLEPKSVMKYFEEISQIPRGSKNEKEISDFLVKFAKDRDLEVIQDNFLNVIIKKPATKGFENVPSIIIQGHMDMVCEKNQGTTHDFLKDSLKLRVEDGWIKATGTTLGADNGIAVAFGLALLDSKDIPHPSLEVLITSDEEMGMSGAQNLDISMLNSKILINIDTEEEGELYVSCAGGARGVFEIPLTRVIKESGALHLKVRGLYGGHSGADIHLQRGNANKIIGRVLNALNKELELDLSHLNGGAKDNAIPREADAIFTVNNKEKALEIIKNCEKTFKNELRVSDKEVVLEIEDTKVEEVFDRKNTEKIISLLNLHPNGVSAISLDIENLIETSLNLGVITIKDSTIYFHSAIRSSILSKKIELIENLHLLGTSLNITFKDSAHYPAWSYRENSKIRDIFIDTFESINGKKPEIKAIHAGLECGLFDEKFEDIDMISFGPDIRNAHTPEEMVNIASVERVWNYFLKAIENMKNYY